MSNEPLIQSAFKLICGQTPSPSVIADGFHSPRGWQERAFDALCKESLMILNAPMGSGKSWLMCLLSAYKMNMNPQLRSIIAVPQTIIAPGFASAKLRMPNGECLHWHVNHNLCRKESSKGTVKYIINWLTQHHSSRDDRVLLCTHATLVKAYRKLKTENKLHLLTNLLLWIDEAHHVKNIAMEDIEGEVISNGIGELVKYLLNLHESSIQLGLTTASFFRGDRCSLLTPTMEKLFSRGRFNLPYDEYLQSMEHLKSFSFDFLLCGQEYTNAIGILTKMRKGKDIIYIPHPKSRHSTGNKYDEVQDIFSEYQRTFGGELVDTLNGLTILQGPNNDFKMLDLVDEDRRIEKKEFLNSDDLKNQRETLDSIIALGMFKEGANWIWADRVIIVGVRASLVEIVQMMGRLFRDAKDKKHVEVIQLLPFSLDQQSDDFRENLNNYLKAVYASLILEDVLNPVTITVPFSTKLDADPEKAKTNNKTRTLMSDLIPDESTRLSVMEDVIHRLAAISEHNRKEGKEGIPALYEAYQSALPEILQDYGITDRFEDIGDKLWSMLLRRSIPLMQGIDVKDIDFEIVQHTHPLQGLLRYTSNACGIDTLTQLREAIRSWEEEKRARWEFYYGLLLKYTEEHGNCRVHKDYEVTVDEKIIKLGSWFSEQKKHFASLPLKKQERLQKLSGFVAKKFKRNQNLSIDAWIDLYISVSKRIGTPLIPPRYAEEGYNIGAWMQHIRKKEEWNKLSPEQKQRLLDNNFKLSPKEEWAEAAVIAMSQFAIREKHTVPAYDHKETIFHKGLEYSIRLDNLRNRIKKVPNEIEPVILEGIKNIPKFLEELKDDMEDDDVYLERGLRSYENFKSHTGLTVIPKGHIEEDFDLSQWDKNVSSRRSLSETFKEKLLKLDPHYFSERSVRVFMQDVQPRIEAFIRENDHALIPQEYTCTDGYLLGQKISDLRERREKLSTPIVDYLSSLGSKWAWKYFEYLHIQNAQRLISYLEKNGYEPKQLPKEIRQLRLKTKKDFVKYPSTSSLKERIEHLAPGIFEKSKDENYPALLRFTSREGHACPSIKHLEDGKKIGLYVSNMRQKYKNDRLSLEECAKFESLKGWKWNASHLQSSVFRKKTKMKRNLK